VDDGSEDASSSSNHVSEERVLEVNCVGEFSTWMQLSSAVKHSVILIINQSSEK